MTGMNKRLYVFDNLKVIMMIFVIITHSIIPYQFNGDRWVPFLWILIMTFTMPMFTFISGYLYREKSVGETVVNYLYPCVIFSLLNNYIGGGIPLHEEKVGGGFFKIGYTMWYIWALFIYNLIIPHVIKLFGVKRILPCSLLLVVIFNILPFPNSFQICRIFNFLPFFVLGMVMKRYSFVERLNGIAKYRKIGTASFIVCIMMYFLITYFHSGIVFDTGMTTNTGLSIKSILIRLFTYSINTLMVLNLVLFVPDKVYWFTGLSRTTLNVYMLHMSVIFVVGWSVLPFFMNEWYGYLYALLFVPLLCCGLFTMKIGKIMNIILLKSFSFRKKSISTEN